MSEFTYYGSASAMPRHRVMQAARTKARRRHRGCHYCGRKSLEWTTDHIVPRALQGPDAAWNLIWSCRPCNEAKGHKMPTCRCQRCHSAVVLWLLTLAGEQVPNAIPTYYKAGPSPLYYEPDEPKPEGVDLPPGFVRLIDSIVHRHWSEGQRIDFTFFFEQFNKEAGAELLSTGVMDDFTYTVVRRARAARRPATG